MTRPSCFDKVIATPEIHANPT